MAAADVLLLLAYTETLVRPTVRTSVYPFPILPKHPTYLPTYLSTYLPL